MIGHRDAWAPFGDVVAGGSSHPGGSARCGHTKPLPAWIDANEDERRELSARFNPPMTDEEVETLGCYRDASGEWVHRPARIVLPPIPDTGPVKWTDAQRAERDREELEAAKRWAPKRKAPPLTDAERAWVADRFDQLAAERRGRADAHAEKIRRTAGRLGREVAAHRLTLADAERRIEALLGVFDPETAEPVALVPYTEARELARRAFTDAYRSTR